MAKVSAGILLYRRSAADGVLEVLLIHPGGPYFARKDDGVWSIPKGEVEETDANRLAAALREFAEETGFPPPDASQAVALRPARLRSGKWVYAWAIGGDADPKQLHSCTFPLEWPPKSGRISHFPEADRAAWMSPEDARRSIHPPQATFLEQLYVLTERPPS